MASTDAMPVPQKNAAYRHYFAIRNKNGDLITSWTAADSEVSLDGVAFTDVTPGEATEIGTSGVGYIDLTAAQMNADAVVLKTTVTNTNAIPYVITFFPEEAGDIRVNATQVGGQTASAAGTVTFPATIASTTNITGGTITTATNVTTVNGLAADTVNAAAIANNAIDATAIAASALDGKGDWNIGKTGYSISGTITTLDGLNDVSAADVNTQVDTALSDIHLDHLLAVDYDPAAKPGVATALFNELIESDGGVSRYTASALSQAPSGGGDATAANQTTIINHLTDVKGAGWVAADNLAEVAEDVVGLDVRVPDTISLANINIQCDTALSDIGLQYLVNTALPTSWTVDITANSALDYMADDGTAAYDRTTDSLQAIADAGGGDATAANQTTIINHLTDVKGSGWVAADNLAEVAEDVVGLDVRVPDTLSLANINAEALDVLNTDTITLPGQVAPPLTPTHREAVGWLYKVLRNRTSQTATVWSLYADNETTVDAKATVSDDTTTAIKQEIITGP